MPTLHWGFAMKPILAAVTLALSLTAAPWPIERLYTRPFVWGVSPSEVTWSKQGHTLLFLWNRDGRRFLDLYAYHPEQQKLVRVTQLESIRDDLNLTEAEKDDRQKRYLMPPEGLTAFQLSHDGARATFAYQGDLYVVNTDGATPPFRLTKTKAPESAPQLSPDGAKIAYQRTGQLFVQDLKNGQLWQVTDVEGTGVSLGSSAWSPDGKWFYYTVRAGSGRRVALPNYSGRLVTAGTFNRSVAGDDPGETKLYVVAAEGGKAKLMDAGPWGGKTYGSAPPEWSPDSKRLLRHVIHPQLKQQQLQALDPSTGKAGVVYEESDPAWANPMSAGWSPDSRQIFFTSDRDGWSHLYNVAAEGGKPQQLTRGPWEIHKETFSRDPQWVGDYLYYSSTEAGPSERQFYRIRSDGTAKERLSSHEGINIGVVSEDGKYTAMLQADLKNPLDLYVNGYRVTTSPRSDFDQYPWPETRFVSFPSRIDRKVVQAKMLLPPGYKVNDRKKQWPAVFFIHGSGYATSVLKQWGSYSDHRFVFNCHLANKGYIVFDLDYRGSSGYGRDWRTGVYLHMGGRDLEDVLGGVDYLRSLGNIDMRRIGIWGVSYGGFMTDMAMFLSPDTFHAGAAFAAVNDWENYNAFYTEQRLTKPQENPEAYRRSSPIYFSNLLKNPLLVVHGIVDNNVMFQDAVELTEKLIQEGKDFAQIYYPEESHGFVRDETLIDSYRRTADWMDVHLR